MSIDAVRKICRAFPGVTEDVKWERPGIIPAPYLARAKWVQETEFGETFDLRELADLLRSAYQIVAAKLPKSRRPGRAGPAKKR